MGNHEGFCHSNPVFKKDGKVKSFLMIHSTIQTCMYSLQIQISIQKRNQTLGDEANIQLYNYQDATYIDQS